MDHPTKSQVSSPASTGGAGNEFEKHVGAYFLSLFLVKGIPPIIKDCEIKEVTFQTEHLGWHTDDILVTGENEKGKKKRLCGQIKRKFTVSSSNEECQGTFTDFWKDFKGSLFSPVDDRFVIITMQGTYTFLTHFNNLLDCAKVAVDVEDFNHRLSVPGLVHTTSKRYFKEIIKILDGIEKNPIDDVDIWSFLKAINTLSLDLTTSSHQTESHIINLLAFTSNEEDTIKSANDTWKSLILEAGEAIPNAKIFTWNTIPEILRDRHSLIAKNYHDEIRKLLEHSEMILEGIKTTIGPSLHIDRKENFQNLLFEIKSNPIVVITGVAGCGKSSMAKLVINELAKDHFTFCFRSEEFAVSHLDETLQKGQIPLNSAGLSALLTGQSTKIILVESVERLLEASNRSAFIDLLSLLKRNQTWRLVLTCRDYSLETVRSSMLGYMNIPHSIINIPLLNDDELVEVEQSLPELLSPLGQSSLRSLLRNPYMLDKATQIPWKDDKSYPNDEQDFRKIFWKYIIRDEENLSGRMPRRRQDTFVEIALRRARKLSLYASVEGLDNEAIQKLHQDSLISFSEETDLLAAPSHDVLEDWAILVWIGEQYSVCERVLNKLCDLLGNYPAIRRTYRKWLKELIEQDIDTIDVIYDEIISDESIPSHFRDDTIISLLQSKQSASFLDRYSQKLFENNRNLLHRLIHLLRVGCKRIPEDYISGIPMTSMMYTPEGTAWETVLNLISKRIDDFNENEKFLLLGLIEDASKNANSDNPYPEASDSIVKVAYWLLSKFASYSYSDEQKRILTIIAKFPKCNPEWYIRLLQEKTDDEDFGRYRKEFRKIALWSINSHYICRDIPEKAIEIIKEEIFLLKKDVERDDSHHYYDDIEGAFGLKNAFNNNCFPASAFQGPFLFLFNHHPDKAISLTIDIFNHCADWYGNKIIPISSIEYPYEVTLVLPDGNKRNQWCNTRLWNLYRGTSVGPSVLQSLLMAFERFLFELSSNDSTSIDILLLGILSRSKSVSITSVISSYATAYPKSAGKTLITLLQTPKFILLDRERLAKEQEATMMANMPMIGSSDSFYMNERKYSNSLSHRNKDLESAILNLQFGTNTNKIHEIIDEHLKTIKLKEEQSEDDINWRLSLHRMDIRQYKPNVDSIEKVEEETNESESSYKIQLDIKEVEPDLKEIVDTSTERSNSFNFILDLLNWGMSTFQQEDDSRYDPTKWHEKLSRAQSIEISEEEEKIIFGNGALEYVATVCIRDHFEELSEDEQDWCIETVCNSVEKESDNWHPILRIQQHRMSGDRPSAWSISNLLTKTSNDPDQKQRLIEILKLALTHPIYEVRAFAATGIGKKLVNLDWHLSQKLINLIATETSLIQKRYYSKPKGQYINEHQFYQIEFDAAHTVRENFPEGILDDAYQNLDISDFIGSKANILLLNILKNAPEEKVSIEAFQRLSKTFIKWWDSDSEHQNFQVESSLSTIYEEFIMMVREDEVLKIIQPLLDSIDKQSDKISHILQGIIGVEDRSSRKDHFWYIWKLFADRIKNSSWINAIDNKYSTGEKMISVIFLTQYWKKGIRHWSSLEGYTHLVEELFNDLPPSSTTTDNYLQFLYHIGEKSLPSAFSIIADRLKIGTPEIMLRKGNSIFLLESLLLRYVYGFGFNLKKDPILRESVLYLLESLITRGSSASYRMRDDFITPISPES